MTNLKDSTIRAITKHGKTLDDIKWVGCAAYKIPIDKFWGMADREFDAGYGGTEVAEDLVVVGDNWWLERGEYDGSEWWEYKEKPKEPEMLIIPETLFPKKDTDYRKFYLYEFL